MSNSISGLIISTHRTVDAASKDRASESLAGWKKIDLSPCDWIKALENGHTIQPSDFAPLPDGSYSHKKQYWKSTRFVFADGDNFRGVETFDDGTEKNPRTAYQLLDCRIDGTWRYSFPNSKTPSIRRWAICVEYV